MTKTWFGLKDFKLRAEGHGRALLAALKLLFVFPSCLGWIWASVKDPAESTTVPRGQGNRESTEMVLEEAMKERQQDQPLLCKGHRVHTDRRGGLGEQNDKMEGKNDLSGQVGEDKSTRK